MSRTRRKLDEAEYFLGKLEVAVAAHPDFDFLLSAFVSSARSVTWVMKAEYKDNSVWAAWYKAKAPTDAERKLLAQMNDLRVRSEKFEPLETRPAIVLDFPPEAVTPQLLQHREAGAGKRFRIWIWELPTDGGSTPPPGLPQNAEVLVGVSVGIVRHVRELDDTDVVDACRQYLARLQELVAEGEAAANAA